jgi:hypothetical protein
VFLHHRTQRAPIRVTYLVRLGLAQPSHHRSPRELIVREVSDSSAHLRRHALRVLLHVFVKRSLCAVRVRVLQVLAVQGKVRDSFLFVLLFINRDVHLDAGEEAYLPRLVPHGREREHVPKRLPLLGVVQKPHRALVALVDRSSNLAHRARVRARPLKETAVPSQDLFSRVPGEVQKPVRREHDGAIRQTRIRDHETLLDAFERRRHVQPAARQTIGGREGGVLGNVPVAHLRGHHRLLDVVDSVLVRVLQPRVVLHQ